MDQDNNSNENGGRDNRDNRNNNNRNGGDRNNRDNREREGGRQGGDRDNGDRERRPPRFNRQRDRNNNNPPPQQNRRVPQAPRRQIHHDFPMDDESSLSDNNNNDNSLNALEKMNYRLEKRFSKNREISLTSPTALAIKLLTTAVSNRTALVKNAIMLRCDTPKNSSLYKILKDPSPIKVDVALCLNFLIVLYNQAISQADRAGKTRRGDKLNEDKFYMLQAFAEDALVCDPQALNDQLESLCQLDPKLDKAADLYLMDRNATISLQSNLKTTTASNVGLCIEFNLTGKCNKSKCYKNNYCMGDHDTPQNHPLCRCPNISSSVRTSLSRNRNYNGRSRRRGSFNRNYGNRSFRRRGYNSFNANNNSGNNNAPDNSNRGRYAQGRR